MKFLNVDKLFTEDAAQSLRETVAKRLTESGADFDEGNLTVTVTAHDDGENDDLPPLESGALSTREFRGHIEMIANHMMYLAESGEDGKEVEAITQSLSYIALRIGSMRGVCAHCLVGETQDYVDRELAVAEEVLDGIGPQVTEACH